jgi:Ca2+-binding EF-hand superfamily protein
LLFAFHHYDINGNGVITVEEFVEAFKREGREITPEQVRLSLMREGDLDGTGDITFEEFKRVVNGLLRI